MKHPRIIKHRWLWSLFACCLMSLQPNAASVRWLEVNPSVLLEGKQNGITVSQSGVLSRGVNSTSVNVQGKLILDETILHLTQGEDGELYGVSGSPGKLLRITNDLISVVASIPDPLATAAVPLSANEWLVAGAPSGKIYRVRAGSDPVTWASTDSRYVWRLAKDVDGRIRGATGDPAQFLVFDADGEFQKTEVPFESHVMDFAKDSKGNWWLGTAGFGRLYRLSSAGNLEVVYDDPLDEVVGVTPYKDGVALALTRLSSPTSAPKLTIKIPRQANNQNPLDADPQLPFVEGIVESEPQWDVPEGTPLGRVLTFSANGESETLWESQTQSAFSIASHQDALWLGLGSPAKVWKYDQESWSQVGGFDAKQVSSLYLDPKGFHLATAKSPGFHRSLASASEGTYTSPPLDAGVAVRWGRLFWETQSTSGEISFVTRTGNTASPDRSWSSWSPPLTGKDGSPILGDEARYLQWRMRWRGEGAGTVHSIRASYLPRNRAPSFNSLKWDQPKPEDKRIEWIWEVEDLDGDPLEIQIEWRQSTSDPWVKLQGTTLEISDTSSFKTRKTGRLSSEWQELNEGIYEVRGIVSDQPGHPPGEGTRDTGMIQRLIVDRTPPHATWSDTQLTVKDTYSPIHRVELWKDGQLSARLKPLDGIADSLMESYALRGKRPTNEKWQLRIFDASGNVMEIEPP